MIKQVYKMISQNQHMDETQNRGGKNKIDSKTLVKIVHKLEKGLKKAYSPYSQIGVVALLITKDGKEYMGVNIENHGIQSMCAERTAFAAAITDGQKLKNFSHIIIYSTEDDIIPCGYCRQFMSEFVDDEFIVYTLSNNKKVLKEYLLAELLPYGFDM